MKAITDINFRRKDAFWMKIDEKKAKWILENRNYSDNRTISRPWVEHLKRQMTKYLWANIKN